MREINFRGWHSAMKKMFSANEMADDQLTLLPIGRFINVHGQATKFSTIYPQDKFIPLQFTGFYDKNGKKIYEGDILRRFEYKSLSEVVWGLGCWRSRVNTPKGIRDYELMHNSGQDEFESDTPRLHNFEVIGNIYENPGLLKAGEQ